MATQKSTEMSFHSCFAHLLFFVSGKEQLHFLNLFPDNFLVHMVHLQAGFWILGQAFNIIIIIILLILILILIIITVFFYFHFLEENEAFRKKTEKNQLFERQICINQFCSSAEAAVCPQPVGFAGTQSREASDPGTGHRKRSLTLSNKVLGRNTQNSRFTEHNCLDFPTAG